MEVTTDFNVLNQELKILIKKYEKYTISVVINNMETLFASIPKFNGDENAVDKFIEEISGLLNKFDKNIIKFVITKKLEDRALSWFKSNPQYMNMGLEEFLENLKVNFSYIKNDLKNEEPSSHQSLMDNKESNKIIPIKLDTHYKIGVKFNVHYKTFNLEGIIDSGSPISVIKKSACDGMLINKYEEKSITLAGLNRSKIEFLGVTHQNVEVNGAELKLRLFIVAEHTMKNIMLLGRDFIKNPAIEIVIKGDGLHAGKPGSFHSYSHFCDECCKSQKT